MTLRSDKGEGPSRRTLQHRRGSTSLSVPVRPKRKSCLGLSRVVPLSLAFTYAFFFEYLPPLKWVRIPFDLESFHYPLIDYAFRALQEGRFPEWDPSIYCGLSFVGNVQAALFYPPTWLVFAANWGRERVVYQSFEILAIAHVWLAFLLCYVWLRKKALGELASVFGAGIFAFSGYMLLQLQHFGVIAGIAWTPLGLWGIDQAAAGKCWRPLWKLVVASSLCFLAGYTPTWIVFCVCVFAYSLASGGSWRLGLRTGSALAGSLMIAMIQLLPAWEAVGFKAPELRYGVGFKDWEFYVPYFIPNYYNFNMGEPGGQVQEYLYLGAPAFFGFAWLVRRQRKRDVLPALVLGLVSVLFVTNPFGIVWAVIRHSSLSAQVFRDWYFLAGITLAAAPLAAFGLDDFLGRKSRGGAGWAPFLSVLMLIAWSLRQFLVWLPGGEQFDAGWQALIEPLVMLGLFTLGLYVVRSTSHGLGRTAVAAVVLLAVGVDYKVFGTSRRFNAQPGSLEEFYGEDSFRGMRESVYEQLRRTNHFRVAVDISGPFPQELRHYGFLTPQGFDPFLPDQYKKQLAGAARYRDGFFIDFDLTDVPLLRSLGTRYVMTSTGGPHYQALVGDDRFHLLEGSEDYYYQVFELPEPQPPYHWEQPGKGRSVQLLGWQAQRREFSVDSPGGGTFVFVEQYFPGWTATVDGRPTEIARWQEAFQSISVPPGRHEIVFEFRSRTLWYGLLISLVSIVALVLACRRRPGPTRCAPVPPGPSR